ncbi:transmembrane protein 69-like isoform X2 [Diadema setosum]|uniref:transmembrane protein 69-like isoform X2 n=1 Tax=Diadema setosum TaxID=31175 RepID=UPI003B3B8C2B
MAAITGGFPRRTKALPMGYAMSKGCLAMMSSACKITLQSATPVKHAQQYSIFSSSTYLKDHHCRSYPELSRFNSPGITPWRSTFGNSSFTSSADHHQMVGKEEARRKDRWWHRHITELWSAPTPAIALGLSGLVPFAVPAAYSIISMSCGPNIAFAQVAYGATILSFLGGVRWGYALAPSQVPSWLSLGYSVTPSLIAWMGLLMPIQAGLFCIISGLALAGVVDTYFTGFPSWFRSLRFFLTVFAVLSISVTFVFSIIYPPPEPEHGYNFRKLIKIATIIVQD